jgi:hypothetical protein
MDPPTGTILNHYGTPQRTLVSIGVDIQVKLLNGHLLDATFYSQTKQIRKEKKMRLTLKYTVMSGGVV